MTGKIVSQVRVASVVTALLLSVAALGGQDSDRDQTALRHFQTSVDEYMALRRDIIRSLPPVKVSAESWEILEASDALRAAIREARRGSHPGVIFTADVRPLLLRVIRKTLRENHIDPAALLAEMNEEVPRGAPKVVFNGRFPWLRGAAMPPCLLATLPPLPAALQYRFVDRELVLVDLDADLVVDLLSDALPIT